MSDAPGTLPPTEAERLGVMTSRLPGGSYGGETRFALDGPFKGPPPTSVPYIVVIEHGDDPDVARPLCVIAWWVGAATPSNAADYDLWYPDNVID